jgi:hypothetical protein
LSRSTPLGGPSSQHAYKSFQDIAGLGPTLLQDLLERGRESVPPALGRVMPARLGRAMPARWCRVVPAGRGDGAHCRVVLVDAGRGEAGGRRVVPAGGGEGPHCRVVQVDAGRGDSGACRIVPVKAGRGEGGHCRVVPVEAEAVDRKQLT